MTPVSRSRWEAAAAPTTNAVAEGFFATLKNELVRRRSWPTRREVIGEVFECIEAFDNPIRRHSTLGYLSPVAFENSTLGTGGSLAAARLASTDDKIAITT